MPKQDAPVQCDACGAVRDDVNDEPDAMGLRYCQSCAARRAGDPVMFVAGRMLTASEIERQADDDAHLANVMQGDTYQETVKAVRAAHRDAGGRHR